MAVNILFLSNWSAFEGITRSTVYPILKHLESDSRVTKIIFCSVEKKNSRTISKEFNKVVHIPLNASGEGSFSKLIDLFRFPLKLRKLLGTHNVDLIWSRGAPAGGIAALAHLVSNVPFVVDSFEPHAQYMIDTGTWQKTSFKYIIQTFLEKIVKRRASGVLPVSHAYEKVLLNENLARQKVFVFPCVVNLQNFKFSQESRDAIRNSLGVTSTERMGIYVGKFGGLYLDKTAFKLFREAFDFWGRNFFLAILSEIPREKIVAWAETLNIPKDRLFIAKVRHEEISNYLSAADFAFSVIKSAPALRYCSAIKHGEYWAADLPIISTLTHGDDADIIKNDGGGVLVDVSADKEVHFDDFKRIETMVAEGRKNTFRQIAIENRNSELITEAVNFVLGLKP